MTGAKSGTEPFLPLQTKTLSPILPTPDLHQQAEELRIYIKSASYIPKTWFTRFPSLSG